ncbi:uncharacterized protein LOC100749993 isoform X1 [Bombus impatiens]|uniref:Uncharacterized protein LOC100749993 isoform X1 n=1 Tax=Bombus impatiens TaxID=132113 RepID=A0A6P6FA66_BOMIM|nr:uncharacterized protein LOC100749993 isoform X1 [Bombus impatiens]XP_024222198.1 uncharacterized protein LOC100749993 isoform X1 [Bombus impatiens]XP_033175672.1 uncharacterized protein LOC100749993 isoform X1 [Bombus impatiens]
MSCVGMSCYEDGFRLAGPASECSLRSKARIDALFEDSRSIYGSNIGGWYGAVSTMNSNHLEDMGVDEQRRVNSAVQARIEAMFASVEAESETPGECAAAILPVKYMGAAPVGGRVASVRGLQEPLRQLLERIQCSVRAELEVSRRGLTFRTSDTCEKNNPFRRIAVWSALRLRNKRMPSGELHHAFLPLVGDHEQSQTSEEKHADLYRTMRGLKTTSDHYSPIFAVVMRRPGATRLLECHAFACETEEDAVAAAATLYRSLLADLDANRRRPRHTNGVGCMSIASVASSVREPSPSSRLSTRMNILQSEAIRSTPQHPVRPPRTKKTSVSSSVTEEETEKSSGLQKAPRRKKKNSDIKAEDVLEARGRRKEASPKEKITPVVQSFSPIQTNFDSKVSKKEERENSKNKTFGIKKEINAPEKIEVENSNNSANKIYDIGANGFYETVSNRYEKLPIIGKAGKIESPAQETPIKEADDVEERMYEKSHGSYDLNNPVSSRDASKDQETHSARSDVVIYDRIDRSGCKSEENALYERALKRNSKERLYEEHFKDVDKIYSLAQEEIYSGRGSKLGPGKIKSSQEDIFFGRSCNNEIYQLSQESRGDSVSVERRRSRDQEKITPGRRVSRVVTMDKPLKKQLSDSTSNLNLMEHNQPRVRKRSRAGSEPPVSRSEDATKALEETRLKRSQSDIDVDRGDLMTRVELPRRGSFLNPGSARRPNSIKGGTPLGFTELFDEFRNQEGLTSVDDILAAIIDPEGMSFNDLKPLYKEFLLKLAATLTQDELYQRSASIMRRRRRPQRRRSSRRTCLLGRAIKRSVSRLKGGPTEFTSVIFPARRLNDSFGSSSSCDARNNHRNRVLANKLGKRRSSWRTSKNGACHTTSEDSDTCRRLNRSAGAAANRSSSGYVSCSECSYDSESCTCVSADKCYCSLSRRIPTQPHVPPNTVVCACDTDSCSESNKCYCARQPIRPTILEQLRQRGIVPSEGTLSRAGSPDKARAVKTGRCRTPSQGLDVLKKQSSSSYGSSNNFALDYDLFNPGRKSQQSSDSEKVLVVSARDTQGRLVYVGGADRDKKCLSHCSSRSGAHHEALSIKKSAEIAAIFGAESSRISRRTSNASSVKSSISLEAGLGYLP